MFLPPSRLSWSAAPDPRRGIFEMTAYTGATLSFVLGIGAAAGPLLTNCISAGLLWRVLIAVARRVKFGWSVRDKNGLRRPHAA